MLRLSVPSTLSRSQLIIRAKTVMKTWLPTDVLDHVCVCASASRDNKSRQSERRGGEREGCWGGWTREDWASAVSSVHSHMAQCPSGTMLNDKEPSPLHHHRQTHLYRHLCLSVDLHTYRCVHTHGDPRAHFQICTIQPHQPYIYTSMHTQKHAQSTFTGRHTHLLHFA